MPHRHLTDREHWLLERNARLAVRLGQMQVIWHRAEGHRDTIAVCRDAVCQKTVAILEKNEK